MVDRDAYLLVLSAMFEVRATISSDSSFENGTTIPTRFRMRRESLQLEAVARKSDISSSLSLSL